jgi:hypothetical protein
MKTVIWLLAVLLPAALFSQNEVTDDPRHGIVGEFAGSSFDQLGYRYRFSLSNSIVLYGKANFFEYDSQNRQSADRNGRHADLTVVYEHSVYRITSARCFLAIGAGYRIHTHENTETRNVYINNTYSHSYTYVNHNYHHTFKGVAGIGGEYFASRDLSVFLHQYIEVVSEKNTDRSLEETLESTSLEVRVAEVTLGVTIYF